MVIAQAWWELQNLWVIRENHIGNKNIPKNNTGNEVTPRRECVADLCMIKTFRGGGGGKGSWMGRGVAVKGA